MTAHNPTGGEPKTFTELMLKFQEANGMTRLEMMLKQLSSLQDENERLKKENQELDKLIAKQMTETRLTFKCECGAFVETSPLPMYEKIIRDLKSENARLRGVLKLLFDQNVYGTHFHLPSLDGKITNESLKKNCGECLAREILCAGEEK